MNANFRNIEITIIDNFSSGKINSLFGTFKNPQKIHEMDVRDPRLVHLINNQDLVIHLAAQNRAYDLQNQSTLYKHNIESTKNIVHVCSLFDIPLIFLSSTSIYERSIGTVDETSLIIPPKNTYALSKFHEEKIVLNYTNGYTLRLGTVHGISPGMNFHTAVNKFCWEAVNSNLINIWNSTANLNSPFLSLNDFNKVLSKLIINKLLKTENRILNLVSHNSTPLDIFKRIENIIPSVKYTLTDGKNLRTHSLDVRSIEQKITDEMNAESIEFDIRSTIELLTAGKINWETFYSMDRN